MRPDGLTTVIGGAAEGPLVGGNLTILCHSIGTPWQADLRGAILFIEEVNDPYWRMDRRIVHLRAAGLLDGVMGVLVGQVHRSGEPEGDGDVLREVLHDVLGGLGVPVLMGFPAGHGEDNITLPMGVRVPSGRSARPNSPVSSSGPPGTMRWSTTKPSGKPSCVPTGAR
jgi:muramoyltetrapeptide carboxypeptidase